jgi:hypothetical protein
MSTATRSAREAFFGSSGIGDAKSSAVAEIVNKNAPRYFVQMGWNALGVDTHAVHNYQLLRGEITPCRTVEQRANVYDVPENMRIPGSVKEGHDGKAAWASYYRYAYDEAERLVIEADKQERKSGLIEVKSLYSELGNEVYARINFNTLFFPNWPIMPDRHEEVLAELNARIEALRLTVPKDINPAYLDIVFRVGDELAAATQLAERVQREELIYTHSCMRLRPSEERYKPRYDGRDYEMLLRTNTPKVDEAELRMATTLEKLSDRNNGGDLNALLSAQNEQLALLREQSARQDKIIEMLFAERQAGKAAEPETPTKPASNKPK